MSERNRIIYNSEGLYVGPAPSSGHQFMNYIGQLNNDSDDTAYVRNVNLNYYDRGDAFESSFYETYTPDSPVGAVVYNDQVKDKNINTYNRNYNLLQKISRVQSITYDINFQRTNISQLNKLGLVDEPLISNPVVTLNFNYLINGVRNEHRLGMNVNFPMFQYPFDGEPYYSGNNMFLFSGMAEQDCLDNRANHVRGESWDISKFSGRAFSTYASWQQTGLVPFDVNSGDERARRYYIQDNAPMYPFSYRDTRNFYVNITPEGVDEGTGIYYSEDLNTPFNESLMNHRNAASNQVMAFGDCQLTTYKCSASVGSFAQASVSYVGNNVSFHDSASGENIPAVWPKDGEPITGKFSIPESFRQDGISVIRNGDMTIDIEASNIGQKLTGINLDSYSFAINLERSELKSLGYQFPLERPINYPIFMQGQFSVIVNGYDTGSYIDLVRDDKILNLEINVSKPSCDDWLKEQKTGLFYDGIPRSSSYNILNYTIKKAKITSVSDGLSIGGNKASTVTFSAELNPEDTTKGFFLSGLHNTEKLFNYLKIDHASGVGSGDAMFLLTEAYEPIICDWAYI